MNAHTEEPTMTTVNPVLDPHEQQAVRRQLAAITAILAGADNAGLPARIANAVAVVDRVRDMRGERLDLNGIAGRLASTDIKEFDVEMAKAIEQVRQRDALDSVLVGLNESRLLGVVQAAIFDDHAEVASRVKVAFDDAVAVLIDVAPRLPGDDPFADPEAVLQAGDADAWNAAKKATSVIVSTAAVFDTGRLIYAVQNAPRPTGALAPVVGIAAFDPERIYHFTHVPVGDDDARQPVLRIRNYAHDLVDSKAEATMVKVARGDYGTGVFLDLAADPAEVHRRCQALNAAFVQRFERVDQPQVQMLPR